MFENFNGPARRALLRAFREARRCQHDFLGTEHLLFGLLCDSSGPAALVLGGLGVAPHAILGAVQTTLHDADTGAALEQFPLSPAVRRAFEHALDESAQLGQALVGPEHLLLGLLHEEASEAALLLAQAGVNLASARRQLRNLSPAEMPGHLVQPAPKAVVASGPDAEPTAAMLADLVAEPRVAERQASRDVRLPTAEAVVAPEVAPQLRVVELQLRITQVALGSLLGFGVGCLMNAPGRAIVLAMTGACLALLRNSLAGAAFGMLAGYILPSTELLVEENWPGGRLLFALIGLFAGSLLGNFWRTTLTRATPPLQAPTPVDDTGSTRGSSNRR